MEHRFNQSLVIRLEMISLEPAGTCFTVRDSQGEGSFYLFNHRILAAVYGLLDGEDALRAILAKKDSWLFENAATFADPSDLGIYLEAILVDLLSPKDAAANSEEPLSFRKQKLAEQYELSVSVQGGPWDGHVFALFPGQNPVSSLTEVVRDESKRPHSHTNGSIFIGDFKAMIVDHESVEGIYLNGRRVKHAILSPEDVITLGEVVLKIHYTARQPVSVFVVAEKTKDQAMEELSRQMVNDGKTINWKQFAPKVKA